MENEDRMIFLNEPEKVDGLYPRDKTMEYKLKLEFEKAAKTGHPKIVSFNEAREANILSNTNFYHLENEGGKMMHTLEAYGWAWLDRAWQSSVTDFKIDGYNSHQWWNEWMGNHKNNMFFHATKIQWLVNIIKTEGLYSVPQALLKAGKWNTHPGQFRVHAIEYTDCNEEFVVWDVNQRLPQPEIDFEEWYGLYSHHNDKHLFAVVDTHKVEMHVGEERRELYDKIVESIDANKGQRPILEGTTDERLEQLFTKGTYEGHGIGIVGDFRFEDLKHIMDFDSSKQIIQKENFTLYNNYHK